MKKNDEKNDYSKMPINSHVINTIWTNVYYLTEKPTVEK